MSKTDDYRSTLRALSDWEPYLRSQSGLPGPRANLELLQVVADEAAPEVIEGWLAYGPERAAENTPDVFLACCATVALGRLLAEGQTGVLPRLRVLANDPRWRVRECVAMALQRLGDANVPRLLEITRDWAGGSLFEQRAAIAAACEPRLLVSREAARSAFDLLDSATQTIQRSEQRKTEDFRVLKKGLAYCWSVAIAALPEEGKARFAAWTNTNDPDIRSILRENLKKNRLIRLDPAWVETMLREVQ